MTNTSSACNLCKQACVWQCMISPCVWALSECRPCPWHVPPLELLPPPDMTECVSWLCSVRATQHERRRKPFNAHPSSIKETVVWSVPPIPRAPEHHGRCGETKEVTEDPHQEADQLCVGAEGEEAVCQTQEQEGQRWGRKRRMQQVGEDPSSPNCTPQRPIDYSLVPGRPGEGEASGLVM